jgi:hypothetical protein
MPSTPSNPRVSIGSYQQLAEAIIRQSTDAGMFETMRRRDPDRLVTGLLGELAASLYIFYSIDPWVQARNRQFQNRPTPDLYPYKGLEIKTLCSPTHALAPIDHVFRSDVSTFYVRFLGENAETGRAYEMLGWLTALQARTIWESSQTTFSDGWRCIPVGCLTPPDLIPWRVDD